MARYEGPAIGGIADGNFIKWEKPKITVSAKRKRMPDLFNPDQFDDEETLVGEEYRFLLLFGNSNAEIGVWAHPDTPTEIVVRQLVSCYNPNTGMLGAPQPNKLPMKG